MTQRSAAIKARQGEMDQRKRAESVRDSETEQRKETVAQKERAETELKKATVVSECVQGIFTAVQPGELGDVGYGDKDLLSLVLGKGAENVKYLKDQPEVEVSIHFILGMAYSPLGFYEEALHQHERSLALRFKLFGSDGHILGVVGYPWWCVGHADLVQPSYGLNLFRFLTQFLHRLSWSISV